MADHEASVYLAEFGTWISDDELLSTLNQRYVAFVRCGQHVLLTVVSSDKAPFAAVCDQTIPDTRAETALGNTGPYETSQTETAFNEASWTLQPALTPPFAPWSPARYGTPSDVKPPGFMVGLYQESPAEVSERFFRTRNEAPQFQPPQTRSIGGVPSTARSSKRAATTPPNDPAPIVRAFRGANDIPDAIDPMLLQHAQAASYDDQSWSRSAAKTHLPASSGAAIEAHIAPHFSMVSQSTQTDTEILTAPSTTLRSITEGNSWVSQSRPSRASTDITSVQSVPLAGPSSAREREGQSNATRGVQVQNDDLFACPFRQNDPMRYAGTGQMCAGAHGNGFEDTDRVKYVLVFTCSYSLLTPITEPISRGDTQWKRPSAQFQIVPCTVKSSGSLQAKAMAKRIRNECSTSALMFCSTPETIAPRRSSSESSTTTKRTKGQPDGRDTTQGYSRH